MYTTAFARVYDALMAQVDYEAWARHYGALMRDAERWGNDMTYPDGYEFITFAAMRWPLIDEAMELLVTTDGPVDFLSQSGYDRKAGDIFPAQGEDE